MDNSKKCFCCGHKLKHGERVCPKCGAIMPIDIDAAEYERNRKTLKWSIIVGLSVGIIVAIILGCFNPNSYLFLIGILAGFLTAYLTSICFREYYRKQDDGSKEEHISGQKTREQKWLEQEEIDKNVLNRGDDFACKMLSTISVINTLWECDKYLDKDNINSQSRSIAYMLAMTPELFLENYFLFKAGDHDDIKDNIYNKCPYSVLETLINMGLFIFKTKNNLYVLKEIINGDKEEYSNSKVLAQQILNKELRLDKQDL